MNYITVIKDKWRLAYDGTQYLIEEYDVGGNEYRNLKTGKTEISSPKWKHTGRYYQNVNKAVKWIAIHVASSESENLQEFIEIFNSISKSIEDSLQTS